VIRLFIVNRKTLAVKEVFTFAASWLVIMTFSLMSKAQPIDTVWAWGIIFVIPAILLFRLRLSYQWRKAKRLSEICKMLKPKPTFGDNSIIYWSIENSTNASLKASYLIDRNMIKRIPSTKVPISYGELVIIRSDIRLGEKYARH
jgi:hypothetical protein